MYFIGTVGNPFPGVSVRITQHAEDDTSHDEDVGDITHGHGNPLIMCEGNSEGTTIQRSLNCLYFQTLGNTQVHIFEKSSNVT